MKIIFKSDAEAKAFYEGGIVNTFLCVGALRAAKCDRMAETLLEHTQVMAECYAQHFAKAEPPDESKELAYLKLQLSESKDHIAQLKEELAIARAAEAAKAEYALSGRAL